MPRGCSSPLWLPATLHSQLENLGLGKLFACAIKPAQAAHAGETNCAYDGCQTIEAGQFASAKSRIAPAILLSPVCLGVHRFPPIAPRAPVPGIFAFRQTETLNIACNEQHESRTVSTPQIASQMDWQEHRHLHSGGFSISWDLSRLLHVANRFMTSAVTQAA